MADIWFTSDHHLGHRNIVRYEPHRLSLGETLAEHDEALVTLHNELVRPGDTVIHLGDLAMGDKSVSLHTASRMHGRKFLVPGNHDSFGKASRRQRPELYEGHGFIPAPDIWLLSLGLGGLRVVAACHYPPQGDSGPVDRFTELRPSPRYPVVIHGHTHQHDAGDGRWIHVGVDGRDFRPVHIDQIKKEIDDARLTD